MGTVKGDVFKHTEKRAAEGGEPVPDVPSPSFYHSGDILVPELQSKWNRFQTKAPPPSSSPPSSSFQDAEDRGLIHPSILCILFSHAPV